jgi:hypothetical protein
MMAAPPELPAQSVSNDRRIGALPAEQSPAASGFITALRVGVMVLSYAIKAAAPCSRIDRRCAPLTDSIFGPSSPPTGGRQQPADHADWRSPK